MWPRAPELGLADVSLLRHRPVQHRDAGGHLADLEGKVFSDPAQGISNAVADDAEARVK